MGNEETGTELDRQFRNQLRVIRAQKGLSQENLAAMLGHSLNWYAGIEQGKTIPDLAKVQQIANVLQVEVGTLLGIGVNTYNNSGSNYVGNNSGSGPIHFQFDKLVLEGLMAKMERYEQEIQELREKLGRI